MSQCKKCTWENGIRVVLCNPGKTQRCTECSFAILVPENLYGTYIGLTVIDHRTVHAVALDKPLVCSECGHKGRVTYAPCKGDSGLVHEMFAITARLETEAA